MDEGSEAEPLKMETRVLCISIRVISKASEGSFKFLWRHLA